jgi:hypothetical protein
MKKNFALFVALSVLFAFSSVASAFTLAEHEKNIEKYVQALNKSPEVVKTYCEMDGTVSERSGALGGEDVVRYVQGENDFSVELRPAGGVIELATQNPAFKLPDGTGVGDPIERVMKAALIPGDYRREEGDNFSHHIWLRDGKMTLITEGDAKIAAIIFVNTIKMKGVTMNDTYAQILAQARDAEPAPQVAANRGDFIPEGFTHRKEWDKLLNPQDLALAGKIYDVLTSFGANKEEVVKTLGNPGNGFSDDWYNGVHESYAYGGKYGGRDLKKIVEDWNNAALALEFIVADGESYVISCIANSNKYKLKHINVGDSIDKAKKTFGRDFDYDDGEQFIYQVNLRKIPDSIKAFECVEINFIADKEKKIERIYVTHKDTGSGLGDAMDDEDW